MGYGEIGRRLSVEAAKDTPYRPWIDTYAGAGYQEVCDGVGALIEQAARRRIGAAVETSPRWPELVRLFRTACVLERDFWTLGAPPGGH